MKFLVLATLMGLVACSSNNLSDRIDENTVPASQEQREDELVNSPDYLDVNDVPAREEERAREEESIVEPAYSDGFYEGYDGSYETDGVYDTDLNGVIE